MNKILMIGNLVRDPEVRYTSGEKQTAITRFTVAVGRPSTKDGQKETDFINCVAFGKTGEAIGKYLTKGRKIGVTGRLQINSFDGKDGQKQYSTDVIVEAFDFCDSKASGENQKAEAEDELPYTDVEDDGESLPF